VLDLQGVRASVQCKPRSVGDISPTGLPSNISY
jgi:hypothetical protein